VGWKEERHSQKLSVQLRGICVVNICGFNPTSFHVKETLHRTANGFILPGCTAESLLSVVSKKPEALLLPGPGVREVAEGSPTLTQLTQSPATALGHSAWDLLMAAPALLTRGVSRADGTNRQMLLFPIHTFSRRSSDKLMDKKRPKQQRV